MVQYPVNEGMLQFRVAPDPEKQGVVVIAAIPATWEKKVNESTMAHAVRGKFRI